MKTYVALLRGVNLGKRQLRMDDLKRIASGLGLRSPRTYIASGNLLFQSDKSEDALKSMLESAIADHMSANVAVMIRDAGDLAGTVKGNPFADEPSNRVVAIFLDHEPAKRALEEARNVEDERMALGSRQIYVHYPSGQGRSKLVIPEAVKGTARNMNTIAKLAELARETS